jgi:NAD(P)-dependent dehydrogenase (short-subunit alcohol dehydrogenase family)
VIGGTQGIGAGIAVQFAELGTSVLVVGHNKALGNEIVKTLKTAAQKNGWDGGRVRFGFSRRDLGSVEQIRAAAEDIARWAVLRQGAQICNIACPGEKNQTIDLDNF